MKHYWTKKGHLFKDKGYITNLQEGNSQLKFKMERLWNLGHRKVTNVKLVLPASGSLLNAHVVILGDHFPQSETWPSPQSCHRRSLVLCNHVNYSKPREGPIWTHNLLFCSYFRDTRADILVRNTREMLLFRFENCWAGYHLISGPRHATEKEFHYDTS